MYALLSIQPQYSQQILAGTKTVEFRKTPFKRSVQQVYIYASAPEMSIVGFFTIKEIVRDHPQALWKRFRKVGGISEQDFFAYYQGKEEGVTYCIDQVVKFDKPKNPHDLIPNFTPPQSFRYLVAPLS